MIPNWTRGLRKVGKVCLPPKLRSYAHFAWLAHRGGYRINAIENWAETYGTRKKEALRFAHECLRLELEPYFNPHGFQHFWPDQKEKEKALLAAADNCLYGKFIEQKWLDRWARADANDEIVERANLEVNLRSLLYAVQFCGGWRDGYAGRPYPNAEPGLNAMVARLGQCPGRLLDLGAGGMPLYPFYKSRANWIASDLALGALRWMRYALDLDPARLVCGDGQSLPFAAESFHVVISRYVIENVLDPIRLLASVFKILTRGGNFILFVPPGRLDGKRDRYYTNRANFPTRAGFATLCRDIGFAIRSYDEKNSLFHLTKPGPLDPNAYDNRYRDPQTGTPFAGPAAKRVDGISVLLPGKFTLSNLGFLPPLSSASDLVFGTSIGRSEAEILPFGH